MNEKKNIFLKRIENPIEVFPYLKILKKLLYIKNIILKKVIRKIIKLSVRIFYEYKYLKCDIEVNTIDNNLLCKVPIKEYKKKYISKLIKNVTKIAEENKVKNVILSNELVKIDELKKAFSNEKLIEGKYLLKVMLDDAINYITNIKNERIENQTVHILVNQYSKRNLEIIEELSYKVKSVNIVTNKLSKFLKFEKYLYENKGIMVTVSNNKRKGLSKAYWIINLDCTNETIQQYKINRTAIFINISEEEIKFTKSFSGIIINGLRIKGNFDKDFKYQKLYKTFNETILYESNISKSKNLIDIKEEIQNDGIFIKELIGSRGAIREVEYKNCLTKV